MISENLFIERLRSEISSDDVTITHLKSDGGSIGIKYREKDRIARVKLLETTGEFKCTCKNDKARRIFDKIKIKYENCHGFDYYYDEVNRTVYLEKAEDMKVFLLAAIRKFTCNGA